MPRSTALVVLSLVLVGCGGSNLTFADDNDAVSEETASEETASDDSADSGDKTAPDTATALDSAPPDTKVADSGAAIDSSSPDTTLPDTATPDTAIADTTPPPPDACAVCPVLANSTATCTAGVCGSKCLEGYADCNGGADGCERNLRTDGENCGACGHSCAGDACVAGMCVPKTLAVGQNDPSDLAVDDTDLFWSNHGANQIVRVAKVGGTTTVFASGQPSPLGIALDDTHVYWTQNATPGAVVRAPKSGGSAQVIASSQYYAHRLVLSGSNVYFTGDSTSGYVRSVPKAGGLVLDLQTASSPKGIAFDGTKLFWTAWNEIRKADPIALAPPTKLSTSEQFPSAIAMDESDIYWTDMYASKVRKMAKTGGMSTTLAFLSSGGQRGSIAVDATHVYFIDPKANAVRKVAKSGGSATTLATVSDPRGLTIDAKFVYFSSGGDGSIVRVAK